MKHIRVRKFYNLLELSYCGGELPLELREELENYMTYTRIVHLRGRDRYRIDPITGVRETRNCDFVKRKLYQIDKYYRFVCPIGFKSSVYRRIKRHGFGVEYIDITPKSTTRHANAYTADWAHMLKYIELRPKQDEALIALDSHDRGLFDAAPGFGKSFIFGAVGLVYPQARIAIVQRGITLVDKLVAELTKVLPSVGCHHSKKKSRGRVMVVSADSMHILDESKLDIVLVDEAHQLLADKYQPLIAQTFRDTRLFGFTATAQGRADGSDARMEAIFGECIFKLRQQEAQSLGLVVPVEVRWMNVFISPNPGDGMFDVAHRRAAVWQNDARNSIIANCARKHADDQVLIIVDKTEHAFMLQKHLPEFTVCHGTMTPERLAELQAYEIVDPDYSTISAADRERMRLDFAAGRLKKVIATDVWSTGVSFDALSVLIRADARASTIMDTQIPGRVTRLHSQSGKQAGVVYDFLDQFDTTLNRYSAKRKKNYESRGWTQLTQSSHWATQVATARTTRRRTFVD